MVVQDSAIHTQGERNGAAGLDWTGLDRTGLDWRQDRQLHASGVIAHAARTRQLRNLGPHSSLERREESRPVHYGQEVEIDNHPEGNSPPADQDHASGRLYSFTRPRAASGKAGPEWNSLEITLEGSGTIVVLNGVRRSRTFARMTLFPSLSLISSRNADQGRRWGSSGCEMRAIMTRSAAKKFPSTRPAEARKRRRRVPGAAS
jgi:hypothetical protein